MINKSVCVIGAGFVGGSLGQVLSEKGITVYSYDKAGKVAPGCFAPNSPGEVRPTNIIDLVKSCENKENFQKIYFVCLPTPMFADGSADLSIVESVLDQLSLVQGERIAVVKSTVPPGSVMKWNKKYNLTGLKVIFNPEFLREATALEDMRNQDRIILGGPRPYINKIKQFYGSIFPNVKIVKTSSSTAEMVKYITNVHLAVKVSLANEFNQICERLDREGFDIDYDKVIEYATYDKRLGESHWAVPGPMAADDGTGRFLRGFAGSCFVKDINALIKVAESLGVKPTVMNAAWEKNLEVRPEKDWENLKGRAVSEKK
jgi:UDPglucose 6-dehydrogenase